MKPPTPASLFAKIRDDASVTFDVADVETALAEAAAEALRAVAASRMQRPPGLAEALLDAAERLAAEYACEPAPVVAALEHLTDFGDTDR